MIIVELDRISYYVTLIIFLFHWSLEPNTFENYLDEGISVQYVEKVMKYLVSILSLEGQEHNTRTHMAVSSHINTRTLQNEHSNYLSQCTTLCICVVDFALCNSIYFNYSRRLNLSFKFSCHHGNTELQQSPTHTHPKKKKKKNPHARG